MSQPSRTGATLSRRKTIVFATITALVPVVLIGLALFGVDLYLHHRAERSAGLNRWGYRGPVAGRKQPGETRLVVLGGSTAFGYGVHWFEAPSAVLQQQLNAARPGQVPVSALNLGFNNEGAYAYRFTLDDFRYLEYDVAVLFDGYNDITGANTALFRHDSPVFRLTGYYPILPLVLNEKAMLLRTGGSLQDGYDRTRDGQPTVFKPGLADRASATALESAVAVAKSLERQIGRLSTVPDERPMPLPAGSDPGCASPWSFYCHSMSVAVQRALDLHVRVVVVLQPRLPGKMGGPHAEQQAAVKGLLLGQFGEHPDFRLVDLSAAVDLHDTRYSFDRMHLTVEGIQRVMDALIAAVGSSFLSAAASE